MGRGRSNSNWTRIRTHLSKRSEGEGAPTEDPTEHAMIPGRGAARLTTVARAGTKRGPAQRRGVNFPASRSGGSPAGRLSGRRAAGNFFAACGTRGPCCGCTRTSTDALRSGSGLPAQIFPAGPTGLVSAQRAAACHFALLPFRATGPPNFPAMDAFFEARPREAGRSARSDEAACAPWGRKLRGGPPKHGGALIVVVQAEQGASRLLSRGGGAGRPLLLPRGGSRRTTQ